ncbi:MAG: stearoyl-CoA 9-desaturase [Bacteroidota bacterium]|nr:stearoyl-CoA 9-desaturase [Bacteroidota bacterium]
MIFIICWLLGLIVGIITTLLDPSIRDLISISNNLLFYQLTVTVSLTNIVGFAGHVFKSDQVAESIGWGKGSFFQKELGFAELGYGIAGLMCIWFKGYFWLATIITLVPLYIGAALVHIKEVKKNNNFNPGNVISIAPDFLIPISLIVLSILSGIWK